MKELRLENKGYLEILIGLTLFLYVLGILREFFSILLLAIGVYLITNGLMESGVYDFLKAKIYKEKIEKKARKVKRTKTTKQTKK